MGGLWKVQRIRKNMIKMFCMKFPKNKTSPTTTVIIIIVLNPTLLLGVEWKSLWTALRVNISFQFCHA